MLSRLGPEPAGSRATTEWHVMHLRIASAAPMRCVRTEQSMILTVRTSAEVMPLFPRLVAALRKCTCLRRRAG